MGLSVISVFFGGQFKSVSIGASVFVSIGVQDSGTSSHATMVVVVKLIVVTSKP